MQSTFFRGTSHDQDARFANKNRQLLTKLKFPSNFRVKVDIKKVALETIKPWISQRITELLGIEDDVVVNLCFNMLSGDGQTHSDIDPRELQINLTGFMGANAKTFVSELWCLLISAQDSDAGIPAELLNRYTADQAIPAEPQPERFDPPQPPSDDHRPPPSPRRRSPSPKKRASSPRRSLPHGRRSPGRRRSRSPTSGSRHRKRSPPRRESSRSQRGRRSRSRSRSQERRRHHDERRRRRRHRHRRSASQSSSSASRERSPSRKSAPPVKAPGKVFDPRAAEDELRMLALRSIVVNKNKHKEEKSEDASPTNPAAADS